MTALEDAALAQYPKDFVGGGRDYKAWAKRILYREEHGDKSLLSVQIKFAQMAMNVQQEVAA